jgi:ribulose-5-phosphate 4-epimerase/fuculose-1-phosphate aldolase
MSELDDLKDQVAKSCRIVGRLHMTREPNGHVSARIPGENLIVIKGRGPDEAPLSYTTVKDLCICDFDGKMVEGRDGLAAANEVFIHTEVLKARPELNSVIHIHPQNIVAFTIAGKKLLPIIGAYNPGALALITDGLPEYPRSVLINNPQLGQDLVKTLGTARICTMRGHGITSSGATVEEATLTAIHLNDLAELQWKAEMLGGARPISDEDLASFSRMGGRGGQQRPQPEGPRRPNSEWRYYEEMLLSD